MLTVREIVRLFPKRAAFIEKRTKALLKQAKRRCKEIVAVPAEERTYANTVRPFDSLLGVSDFIVFARSMELLEMVSPLDDVRKAAHDASVTMKNAVIDIRSHRKIYRAFTEYVQGTMAGEELSSQERYFIEQTMLSFKRNGLHLPDDQLATVKVLQKDIAALSADFARHIAEDTSAIWVEQDELAGLESDFITALKRTQNGRYRVGVDYPTYFAVMQRCSVAQTREKLWRAFHARAYPANEHILQELIAKRDELAHLLGYASYAHYDLENQMVGTPERADAFLDMLLERSSVKEAQEFRALTADLPEGIELIDGKLAPWDYAFVKERAKKKLQLDDQEIAHYFPVEKALEGLLAIYETFFSLTFEEMPVGKLWSNDVRMLAVYDKQLELIGYILLDLYPRANKYSHACNLTLVPAVYDKEGKANIALSAIVANFPRATQEKPALLTLHDVSTFFHEFGHALHGLLGRTHVALLSGYETKMDFVEMPSQILEEWLHDREILKKVSSHYQTGQSLPDVLIDALLANKHFDTGFFVLRQIFLSKLSLVGFLPGARKDMREIQQHLATEIMRHTYYLSENYLFASFGHLTEYGPKYYGYLWSKVFALDIFSKIKEGGLLNPAVGERYVNAIIGRGGTDDPHVYMRDFLGRDPSNAAFFADMGL